MLKSMNKGIRKQKLKIPNGFKKNQNKKSRLKK